MSNRLPALTAKEVIWILEHAGFRQIRQRGSHLTMYRQHDRRALTIPVHFSKTIPAGTLSSIIKQAGMTSAEFKEMVAEI